jgi:hypothetical protein
MKLVKIRLSAAVRSTIESHLGLLETLAADPPDESLAAARVAPLRRPAEDPSRLRKP